MRDGTASKVFTGYKKNGSLPRGKLPFFFLVILKATGEKTADAAFCTATRMQCRELMQCRKFLLFAAIFQVE